MSDIFVSITRNGETSTYVTVDLTPGTACLVGREAHADGRRLHTVTLAFGGILISSFLSVLRPEMRDRETALQIVKECMGDLLP